MTGGDKDMATKTTEHGSNFESGILCSSCGKPGAFHCLGVLCLCPDCMSATFDEDVFEEDI
jgi:hypothetical protein